MARVKIPFLVSKPGRGGGTRYFWQPSAALRVLGWRAGPTFHDQGEAIVDARARNERLAAWRRGADRADVPAARVKPGTLKALAAKYKKNYRYTDRPRKTRAGYDWNMKVLLDEFGDDPVAALDAGIIEKFYLLLRKDTPAKAEKAVVMARILFGFAQSLGKDEPEYLRDNPARHVRVAGAKRSGLIWPADAVAALVAAAEGQGWPSIGTIVTLNEWIGQREGDVLALPRNVYRDGLIVIRQSKTGAQVALPVNAVPKLVAAIEAEQARQRERKVEGATALILCESTGQAWRADHFRHVFAEVRAKAAEKTPTIVPPWAPDRPFPFAALKFMHFRHTAVTRLAEAGCPATQIRAITGHSLSTIEQILERYLVNTPALAAEAFKKRLAREQEK